LRARDVLGPAGPLSRGFRGYEDRPGQLAMADAVERALEGDRVLVCEAGTGTGKTLAYLVPAILSGRKVIVSTATRALQEQIFTKDIPLIRETLGLPVSAALMKGLSNYLCLRRFAEYRTSPEAEQPSASRALAILESWAASTGSGDVAEIGAMSEDEPIWREVSSSSETRIGQGCEFFSPCHVTRMKRDAEAARIIVVNHHLFFADLALRGPHTGAALPDYDAVIFDEAHQLEDIATDFFGVRVSSTRLVSMLRDTERAFVAGGLSDKLLRKGEGAVLVELARESGQHFFAEIAKTRGAQELRARRGPAAPEGRATIGADFWTGDLLAAYHKLDASLEALASYAEARQTSEAVEVVTRRASQLREDLAAIVDGSKNQVTWAEVRTRSAAIGASPVNLAETLQGRLFAQVPAVVLTSATLAANHSFSYLRSRLGLSGDELPVEELEVPSPFDYESNALLYLPRDLPEPTDPAWLPAAEERIAALVEASDGGAFVLSTSKRVMQALHLALVRRSKRAILVQGEAPKTALLEKFRKSPRAVLVATMSFWEGVDVPGKALRLVIIDKIPFQVPSDPVVLARSAAIEAQGQNPFAHYHVPAAAITLKQGFGRLIRSRKDAGIVAILDKRVHTKNYGKTLLQSLPPARRTEDLEETRAFAQRLAGAED
ncbi:MAG: ATP-dependent DNA helicase, partial [Polyangiaceae bacterium]